MPGSAASAPSSARRSPTVRQNARVPEPAPLNALEHALAAALANSDVWEAFYLQLRGAQVLIGHVPDPDSPDVLDEHGVPRGLRSPTVDVRGETHNTIFTTRERAIAYLGPTVARFQVPAAPLMRLSGRLPFYVNPGSRLSVSLPGDLVAWIADSSTFERPPVRTVEVAKLGTISISRPPKPQTHIARALTALFESRRDVDAAYIAWWTESGGDAPPHAVVGIETTTPFAELAAACDAALTNVTTPNVFVDFVPMDRSVVCSQIRGLGPPFFRKT